MIDPDHLQCPHCGEIATMDPLDRAELIDQTVACNACRRSFIVPHTEPERSRPFRPGGLDYASPRILGPQTNGFATASLICGLIFLVPFCWPMAIVFGIAGIRRARKPGMNRNGMRKSILGICLGFIAPLLFLSIIPISFGHSREAANRVVCAANMRSIGQFISLYANENNHRLPDSPERLMTAENVLAAHFVCPSGPDNAAPGTTVAAQAANLRTGNHDSYIYLGAGHLDTDDPHLVLLYEPLSDHGRQGCNMLFGDGHVEFIKQPAAGIAILELQAGQNPPPALRGY